MRKILILVITVLAANALFGWDIIRQAAFPANFYSLDVIGSTVWAVGSGGAVAKSTDDGQTWAFVPSPFFDAVTAAYRTVEDVDFMSQNDGVAVGGMGIVAITADGGQNWTYPATAQAVIGTTELKSAVYLPSGQIWVCGSAGMIAYSPDFGATWSLQNAGITTILYGMSMNDAGTGFIVLNKGTPDQSKILKTYNFGATWTLENLPVTGNPSIYNVRQFGNKVILVGDYGYLGYSDDNGATWTHHPYAAGSTSSDELHDVVMLGDTGYAVGWNYRIITTTDGWATFTPVIHDFSASYMEGIARTSQGGLVACGWQGTLALSNDGAVTWADCVPNAVDLWQASILDADNWFIAGDKGNVLKTSDGGQTLIKRKIPGFDGILYACHFKNASEGLVSGKTVGNIYRTIDGGETWTSFTIPGFATTKSYYDFFFLDDLFGYVVGVGGKVASTADGGVNWTLLGDNINTAHNLYCTYWKSATNGYAGSGSGLLYITTNGGVTWNPITIGGSANIRDIWFRDANNGVLVKENGEIFYTITGGNTQASWIAASESAASHVTSVMCDHNGVYWAAGYSNDASQQGNTWALMKSLDNGATWTPETFPALTFNATRFLNIGTGGGKIVAVGRNNLIVAQLEVPEHVALVSPPDNSQGLDPENVTLSWTPSPYGSEPAYYTVFLSSSLETIFDEQFFETGETSFDLPAQPGVELGYGATWYWAALPVNEELDAPDPASGDFMIWRFSTFTGAVLEAPILAIEKIGNQVRLNWAAVPGAISYRVLGSVDPTAGYTQLGVTAGLEYLIPDPGAREFFKVIASTDPALRD